MIMSNTSCRTTTETFCQRGCPYFDDLRKACGAAADTRFLHPACQTRYCLTDDYDDCPLYLCQALRSSQSLGHDRESLKSSGK